MVKDYTEFAKQLQAFHLKKPPLQLGFEDNLTDDIKQKWNDMDKVILELIWAVNNKKGTAK